MRIERPDLDWAVAEGLLDKAQADTLWAALEKRAAAAATDESERAARRRGPPFDALHVAYYFGALIVIAAMGMFMTLGWEALGGLGIAAVSAGYATAFVLVGRRLWFRDGMRVPGGLLYTMAVCMTPLLVYGIERAFNWWPASDPGSYRGFHEWIKGGWFAMELSTVLAALLALRKVRFPFLVMPIAFIGWYMSMDLAPLLFHDDYWGHWQAVSIGVGLVMLVAAWIVDRRTDEDFAFWLYLFGVLAFWSGVTGLDGHSELRRFLYCLLNLGMIVVSVVLRRRVFLVFGVLGVTGYLGYLSWTVFKDSLAFPFVLSGIGLAIVFAAVQYHRKRLRIEAALLGTIPPWLKRVLPTERKAG